MAVARRGLFAYPRQWSPRMVPTWPVEINRGHPLATGLTFLVIPAFGSLDLTNTVGPLTLQSASTIAASALGPGLSSIAANQGAYYPNIPNALKLQAGTVCWAGSWPSFNATDGVYLIGATANNTNTSPYCGYGISSDQSGNITFLYNNTSTYVKPVIDTWASSTTAYAAAFNAASSVRLFKNGIFVNSMTMSATISLASDATLNVGCYNSTATRYCGAITSIASIYNYVLPDALATWVTAEPFAMLRPIIRRSYVFQGALGRPLIIASRAHRQRLRLP